MTRKPFYVLSLCLFTFLIAAQIKVKGQSSISTNNRSIVVIDTSKVIGQIRDIFRKINSNIKSFTKVEKQSSEESSEGGDIVGYFKDGEIKKVTATYYGGLGQAVTEYYFDSTQLVFVFKEDISYDKPFYMKDSKVATREQSRYYFLGSDLLLWLDNKKRKVDPNKQSYQEVAMQFNKDVIEYAELLKQKK